MNEGYSKSKALAHAQAQRSSHNCEPPILGMSCNPEHYILKELRHASRILKKLASFFKFVIRNLS